jgi:sugar lactone lactonase YvrE
LRHSLDNVPAGTYVFTAKAGDDDGAVTVSSPITITINASGPVVSLVGMQPFFTSSPGTLVAHITGVNPGALTALTLNGVPITPRAGEFLLNVPLAEGENTFTLLASGSVSATTKVYLDSVAPVLSITAPVGGLLTTDRINVSGTFTESSLKQITVNGVRAFISGNNFNALNVPLAEGPNPITATAEDIAGNITTSGITVTGSATPVDPAQLAATPVGGFVSLQVTFTPQINVPGTIEHIYYDFDGDNGIDLDTGTDTTAKTHTYNTAGEYFPVVTILTSVGKFSSLGGWNAWNPDRLRINVQTPPVQDSVINVTAPFDIRVSAAGDLYVLSMSGPTISQYNASGMLVRSLSGIGSSPHCLDVDGEGNVYVAMTLDNKVWKFKPDGGTFMPDNSFNETGWIGAGGSGDGQFAYPYGVAVSPDGEEIAVADQLNHRIQRFSKTGEFQGKFGEFGSALGQFNYPRGLDYDHTGMLYIVDSGNNRIVLALSSDVIAASGTAGSALGQFQGPLNVRVGSRGIYVADYGNSRIQYFDPTKSGHGAATTPFNPRGALSSQLSLNLPRAVAPIPDLLTEKIYIADTGNNRVLKVTLPETAVPDSSAWDPMKTSLLAGNIEAAVSHFSIASAEDYRRSFISIGATALSAVMNKTLTPVVINGDRAQYYFEDATIIPGETITFPVEFVKENGIWKISEF